MRNFRQVSKARIILMTGLGWQGCENFSKHHWKWWA